MRIVIPGEPAAEHCVVTLCEGRDGVAVGRHLRQRPVAHQGRRDHASSPPPTGFRATRSARSIRTPTAPCGSALSAAAWTRCATGRFCSFTAKDGLLSDNIADVADDGESLWLSTTRGICRIAKQQLREFAAAPAACSRAGQLRRGGRPAQRAVLARLSHRRRRASARPTGASGSPPAAAWRSTTRRRRSSTALRARRAAGRI